MRYHNPDQGMEEFQTTFKLSLFFILFRLRSLPIKDSGWKWLNDGIEWREGDFDEKGQKLILISINNLDIWRFTV